MRRSAVAAIGIAFAAASAAAQHNPSSHEAHHAAVDARGARVMGFDQAQTIHRFRLYQDGGAIEVAVKDPADAGNRDAIRSHLPHIAAVHRFLAFQIADHRTGDDAAVGRRP